MTSVRCKPSDPCPAVDDVHLRFWGECFHLGDEGDLIGVPLESLPVRRYTLVMRALRSSSSR